MLAWLTTPLYAQADPPQSATDDEVTDAAAATAAPSTTPAIPAPDAFRYRVVIDAPAALKPLIESNVGLVRWQSYEDMTAPLFDRLAREAVTATSEAAASLGWFSAHTEVEVNTASTPAVVTLRVDTGAPTRVHDVQVDVSGPIATDAPLGTEAIADARESWLLPSGEVFSQQRWNAAKARVVATLASAGYPATQVSSSEAAIDPESRQADLSIALASGPLFHFGELQVQGLQRYPASMVRNFSTLQPGDRYDARALDVMVRRLNASGYFSSVHATINADPAVADAAPVTIAVIEAPTRHVEYGFGYSTDTEFRANASYRDVNINDRGLQFSADLRLEQKVQSGSLRLVWPPGESHWINSAVTEVVRTNIENLITETAMLGARRQTVDERDNWAWGAAMYFDRQDPDGAPATQAHALYIDLVRTWRRTDDLVAPTRGYNVALQVGGGVPGVSSRGFGRVIAQWAGWHPLDRQWSLSGRAEAGAVIAESREGIPSALLFRTGGDTTVRGYAFQSLGVKSGDAIVPGRYYAVASGEITRWFSETIGMAAFVDAGNAVDEVSELSHLALGYGLGARLRTPIGPFRFDVAYGQDTHKVRLHLSVGLAF